MEPVGSYESLATTYQIIWRKNRVSLVVTLETCIRETLCSKSRKDTFYLDSYFRDFTQSLPPGEFQDSTPFRLQQLRPNDDQFASQPFIESYVFYIIETKN